MQEQAQWANVAAIKATGLPSRLLPLKHKIDAIGGSRRPVGTGISTSSKKDAPRHITAVIGPSAKGAQLEGSKGLPKEFMLRHPHPYRPL